MESNPYASSDVVRAIQTAHGFQTKRKPTISSGVYASSAYYYEASGPLCKYFYEKPVCSLVKTIGASVLRYGLP